MKLIPCRQTVIGASRYAKYRVYCWEHGEVGRADTVKEALRLSREHSKTVRVPADPLLREQLRRGQRR